jgi:hypothetical protein
MAGFQVIIYGRFWVITEDLEIFGLSTKSKCIGRLWVYPSQANQSKNLVSHEKNSADDEPAGWLAQSRFSSSAALFTERAQGPRI